MSDDVIPNVAEITRLLAEATGIDAAAGNLAAGGVITMMTISGGPLGQPQEGSPPGRSSATIMTTGIFYPAAMVTAITDALTARKNEIVHELGQLGVTLPGGR